MNINQRALEIAIGEIGKGEEGENNAGSTVEKYLHGLAEPPANWCAAFVCWCFLEVRKQFGPLEPFDYTLSARHLFNQFKRRGWLIDVPESASLVFFWRGSPTSWMGHVGFVEKVDFTGKYLDAPGGILKTIAGGILKTIEGNKGKFPAKVTRYDYAIGHIPKLLGYGRVKC